MSLVREGVLVRKERMVAVVRIHGGENWAVVVRKQRLGDCVQWGEVGGGKGGVEKRVVLWTNFVNSKVWRYATISGYLDFPNPTSCIRVSGCFHSWRGV